MENDIVKVNAEGNVTEEVEDGFYLIRLSKPYIFEGKSYDKIDLTGLEDICAADMIAVNRKLNRNGNVEVNQELTLEYALHIAARATQMPIEFFEQMPPRVAMQIKTRMVGFLYGRE